MTQEEILREVHEELDRMNDRQRACVTLVEEMLKSFPGIADEKLEKPDGERIVDYLIARVHQLNLKNSSSK